MDILLLGSSHGGTVESDLREDRLNSELAEIETKVRKRLKSILGAAEGCAQGAQLRTQHLAKWQFS